MRRLQANGPPFDVAAHATKAGFPRLARAGKTTVWRILDAHELKPHRVRYYLDKRDPQFERKMAEVLVVYRDVNLYRAGAAHDARVRDHRRGVSRIPRAGWPASCPPRFHR